VHGLVRSTIEKTLQYGTLKRAGITRTGRPVLLTGQQADEIIKYVSEYMSEMCVMNLERRTWSGNQLCLGVM
jgi:hypothetical protein